MQKKAFCKFIKEYYFDNADKFIASFEKYHNWLVAENININLISRKTDISDYWTRHFLDSILPIHFIDFYNKRILDFGTGGGLPGIPLAILNPTSYITLLDSIKKKIASIERCATHLSLKNCEFIGLRIEEMPHEYYGQYDIIVCRSVKILPKYKKTMLKLLKNGGRIILYKSKELDDIKQFNDYEIHDVSCDNIGTRKIIEIFTKQF